MIGSNPITSFESIRVNKQGIKSIDVSSIEAEEITVREYTNLNSFISSSCRQLRSLSISDCAQLNDITLTECEALRVLELARTPNLNLMNLESLSITTIRL